MHNEDEFQTHSYLNCQEGNENIDVYMLQQQITGQFHIQGRPGKKAILVPIPWFSNKGIADQTTYPNSFVTNNKFFVHRNSTIWNPTCHHILLYSCRQRYGSAWWPHDFLSFLLCQNLKSYHLSKCKIFIFFLNRDLDLADSCLCCMLKWIMKLMTLHSFPIYRRNYGVQTL